jgi:eukaryotic-like serine/threonine-protein kinase
MGLKTYNEGEYADALSYYKRAIELDPSFAMAYARLGGSYWNLGQYELARQTVTKAYELRERVSEKEKFYILGRYHDIVTRDIEQEVQAWQTFAKIYPREEIAHRNLSSIYGGVFGESDGGWRAGCRWPGGGNGIRIVVPQRSCGFRARVL